MLANTWNIAGVACRVCHWHFFSLCHTCSGVWGDDHGNRFGNIGERHRCTKAYKKNRSATRAGETVLQGKAADVCEQYMVISSANNGILAPCSLPNDGKYCHINVKQQWPKDTALGDPHCCTWRKKTTCCWPLPYTAWDSEVESLTSLIKLHQSERRSAPCGRQIGVERSRLCWQLHQVWKSFEFHERSKLDELARAVRIGQFLIAVFYHFSFQSFLCFIGGIAHSECSLNSRVL